MFRQHKLLLALTILGSALVTVHSNPSKFSPSTGMNPFVVGGQDVTIEEYPFVVVCYSGGSFGCGGSIVGDKWVLTAGHCSCSQIQYGVTQRQAGGPNMINVAEAIRYPGWTSYIKDDVQLLRLESAIPFSAKAQPVKFPQAGWEVQGESFQTRTAVLGWGYDTSGNLPYTMQIGNYFAINNRDCQNIHSGVATVYDFNCCNGVRGGGVADCNGDSGGPIITWIDGQVVEYGVVSWSVKPCTNPTYPAVGTKTSHYVGWISEVTGIPLSSLTI